MDTRDRQSYGASFTGEMHMTGGVWAIHGVIETEEMSSHGDFVDSDICYRCHSQKRSRKHRIKVLLHCLAADCVWICARKCACIYICIAFAVNTCLLFADVCVCVYA